MVYNNTSMYYPDHWSLHNPYLRQDIPGIHIDSGSAPEGSHKLRPLSGQSTISQRINTISQQILSRTNIEKIIDQFGLFENADNMYLEDKVAAMRKRIQVKIGHTRSGAEAFSIVFKGSDPEKVMRIANTLASYFMDENLKLREAQAMGTSNFLDSQLEQLRKGLQDREKNLHCTGQNILAVSRMNLNQI